MWRVVNIMAGLLCIFGGCKTKPQPKPKPPIDNREKWKALAPFVKKHFKTDMTTKEIAAELSYQEYLKNKDKK